VFRHIIYMTLIVCIAASQPARAAPAVVVQFTHLADDAVAGDEIAHRITGNGADDRSCGSRPAQVLRHITIAHQCPRRNRQLCLPHLHLEVGDFQVEMKRPFIPPNIRGSLNELRSLILLDTSQRIIRQIITIGKLPIRI